MNTCVAADIYSVLIKYASHTFLPSSSHYSYEGSPRHVATPGDGVQVSDGSYGILQMNGKKVYTFAT